MFLLKVMQNEDTGFIFLLHAQFYHPLKKTTNNFRSALYNI